MSKFYVLLIFQNYFFSRIRPPNVFRDYLGWKILIPLNLTISIIDKSDYFQFYFRFECHIQFIFARYDEIIEKIIKQKLYAPFRILTSSKIKIHTKKLCVFILKKIEFLEKNNFGDDLKKKTNKNNDITDFCSVLMFNIKYKYNFQISNVSITKS